nr:FAD-dependent oxidoreductase [Halorubellus sp. JP-L1]
MLVLGGGTGNVVASTAADAGLDVGLVERGPLGGTCLNRGCNPSKQLIHHANVVEIVRSAGGFDVDATLEDVDFASIVEGVTAAVTGEAERKEEAARANENLTFYQTEGRFVDERVVEVDAEDGPGGERLTADDVVLAGGSRPAVPDAIDGTSETDFLTSDDALRLADRPDHLVVVGGGYVAVELAHFFGQMGASVTIVGHGDVLLSREDREIAERLTDAYRERFDLHLGYRATEIGEADGGGDAGEERVVHAETEGGEELSVRGDELLLAVGRKPNADLWNVSAAGIETDDDGYVETDEYLETSTDGVYAIGDVAGNYQFKHSGDKEAEYVVNAVVHDDPEPVEYPGMAHAVFGSPEVASLGQTEDELEDSDGDGGADGNEDEGGDGADREDGDGGADHGYAVGTCAYADTALGAVVDDRGGFAKAIVGDDGEILGCHVVGPDASMLVHEVSTAVAAGADAETVAETIHVHPALSEVVQGAFRDAVDFELSGF